VTFVDILAIDVIKKKLRCAGICLLHTFTGHTFFIAEN
jgi:hypothetical protein